VDAAGLHESATGAHRSAPELLEQPSPRNYAVAVALSSLLGLIGLQHFYLGRWLEGLVDVGLTFGWVWAAAVGEPLWFGLFLVADIVHAFYTTILLLTGNFTDGDGLRVCYPGQRLGARQIG
jgi:TM2 domain-containing membrane protein YozV